MNAYTHTYTMNHENQKGETVTSEKNLFQFSPPSLARSDGSCNKRLTDTIINTANDEKKDADHSHNNHKHDDRGKIVQQLRRKTSPLR